jgi:LemA family
MEMCIDNPREGFGELFDTHPSVDSRVAALVKFAGGHDPGPLAHDLDADQADSGALRQLFGLTLSYPDLKANTNFQQVQAKLADLETAEKALRRKAEGGSEQRGAKAWGSAQGALADASTTRSAAMLAIAAISLMIVSFLIASVILTVFD